MFHHCRMVPSGATTKAVPGIAVARAAEHVCGPSGSVPAALLIQCGNAGSWPNFALSSSIDHFHVARSRRPLALP
jgi:hypothetical protein